jgi:hypothetical protein
MPNALPEYLIKELAMLELRPKCECCEHELPADSQDAFICSYECTFCRDCVENRLHKRCPNCAGELLQRPRRIAAPAQ